MSKVKTYILSVDLISFMRDLESAFKVDRCSQIDADDPLGFIISGNTLKDTITARIFQVSTYSLELELGILKVREDAEILDAFCGRYVK